jgi:Zn-dependent membrane protease YugP
MFDYLIFMLALAVCGIFAAYANSKVNNAYSKYGQIRNRRGVTGADAAARLLYANGVTDIRIGHVSGTLTDHYHPTQSIVNLSDSTYGSATVAAVAVAAHEIGHVMQNKKGFIFYNLRTALVPVVNIGTKLAMPLVLIGLALDFLVASTANSDIGYYLAMFGVLLYGASFLFTVVTLPVELDASRRAKKMLVTEGILRQEEMSGAEEVLSAAALTYLASMFTSLVYFLRFMFFVLRMFGNRRAD